MNGTIGEQSEPLTESMSGFIKIELIIHMSEQG